MVLSQLPKTTVLGIRGYASNQQQGKQILLRDHGVFGMLIRSQKILLILTLLSKKPTMFHPSNRLLLPTLVNGV
jgi:hypothetical protein